MGDPEFAYLLLCGAGQDRTADTRIFSPVLYLLSYRTKKILLYSVSDSNAYLLIRSQVFYPLN